MTLYQLAEIFGNAYAQTATMNKALNAFQLCGIWPLNPNILNDDDFLPSTVTDQTVDENIENSQPLDIITMATEFDNNHVPSNQTIEEASTVIVVPSNELPVSPLDIIPLPKSTKKKATYKRQKIRNFVFTPYKTQLETLGKEKKNGKK